MAIYFPSSTYRIQTCSAFTLQQIKEIIPYLDALGISTVYSAPFFQASEGSTHGYDVMNPHRISDETGDHDEMVRIAEELKKRNMSWLQDIVPNHMAFSAHNPWIHHLLELGQHSPYYTFFDINWLSEDERYFGKVMMPFLGSPLEEVLEQQQLKLAYGDKGIYFDYFENIYPLKASDYYPLVQQAGASWQESGATEEEQKDYTTLLAALKKWHKNEVAEDHSENWESAKEQLQELLSRSDSFKESLKATLKKISQDRDALQQLLSGQNFRLAYWKDTEKEINYRRFFTVNDLICLNIQLPEVFQEYHRYIKQLVDDGLVQGLRVDHVDGLFDPTGYLFDLRKLAGDDTYLIVEKILEAEEGMPDIWPIQGTSGYEFLAQLSQLFTHSKGEAQFTELYKSLSGPMPDYDDLVYQNKMFILLNRMHGELNNLMDLLRKLDIIPYQDTAEDWDKLKQALAALLAAFPLYRIYANEYPFSDTDMHIIGEAFAQAESKAPSLGQYFQRLREIFNGVPDRDEQQNKNRLYFVMRCQQFTGPLAAKGVEDTTFYVYNRLISHNEVGDTPAIFGISVDQFHQIMQQRSLHSINTTATHDTKRGEDARMRINALSEMGDEWQQQYRQWKEMNSGFLSSVDSKQAPDENDTYFLYQTLVGTYPVHVSPEEENYQERLTDYMNKAMREAKRMTSWSSPNEDYEKALSSFVKKVLNHQPFLTSLQSFVEKVARHAAVYSLGQTLLKVTAPGIPDVYQGTEYWDLSMVDPDNRRPVDYKERTHKLRTLEKEFREDATSLLRKLGSNLLDPSIKMFALSRALQARKNLHSFFLEADYQPLQASGSHAAHVMSFMRSMGNELALVVVPLHTAQLTLTNHLPLGEACWQDTVLPLGQDGEGSWIDIFSGKTVTLGAEAAVAQLLKEFPVAFLIKQ